MALDKIEFMRGQLLSFMKQVGGKIQIIQEPIPAELQFQYAMDYLRLAPAMQKMSDHEWEEFIDKALNALYLSHDVNLQRDLLTQLSAIKLPRAHSVLKQYCDEGKKVLRDWATIALMGSRLNLTEDFTGDNMILVVSGLGGVDDSIRYNLVLVNRLDRPFNDFEKSLILKESKYHLGLYAGQLDQLDLNERFARLVFLMPISESPTLFLDSLLAGINEFRPLVDCPNAISSERYYSDADCLELVGQQRLCLVV